MQWILQDFEDTRALGVVLDRLGLNHSWHKVVPFVGDLVPEPEINEKADVVLFGSYTLWRYAERLDLKPGVFKLRPFLHEAPWQDFLLNGKTSLVMALRDVPEKLPDDGRLWFMRPVDDSKAEPGRVRSSGEIHQLAQKVLALDPDEIIRGALAHDTELMFSEPTTIQREWRIWVVNDAIVTSSLYKEGRSVVYRCEIDLDAHDFAMDMIARNPIYAQAYVLDICRTDRGLHILETNCINAAGFYAADLFALVEAIESL
ncbi:MAG: ATP-grasp domain-containing protein [Pseudomonadota bacterium]